MRFVLLLLAACHASPDPKELFTAIRARDAARHPMDTVHGTLDKALVMANTENGVPRPSRLNSSESAS